MDCDVLNKYRNELEQCKSTALEVRNQIREACSKTIIDSAVMRSLYQKKKDMQKKIDFLSNKLTSDIIA